VGKDLPKSLCYEASQQGMKNVFQNPSLRPVNAQASKGMSASWKAPVDPVKKAQERARLGLVDVSEPAPSKRKRRRKRRSKRGDSSEAGIPLSFPESFSPPIGGISPLFKDDDLQTAKSVWGEYVPLLEDCLRLVWGEEPNISDSENVIFLSGSLGEFENLIANSHKLSKRWGGTQHWHRARKAMTATHEQGCIQALRAKWLCERIAARLRSLLSSKSIRMSLSGRGGMTARVPVGHGNMLEIKVMS
jgi:hypothetical protein